MESSLPNPRRFVASCRIHEWRHGLFLYPTGDNIVGRSIELYGEYSPTEAKLLRAALQPEMLVLDCGANLGSLTMPMASSGATVLAFEPQLVVNQILKSNAILSKLDNKIYVHHMALGERQGTVKIPIVNFDIGGNFGRFGEEDWAQYPSGTDVDVFPLDQLLEKAKVAFIKLDVEGMELQVLRGAEKLIARCRPVMLVENDRPEHCDELIRTIYDLSYTPYWFITPLFHPDNWAGNPENVFASQCSFNMLCLPSEGSWLSFNGLRKVELGDPCNEAPGSWVITNI